ncbi:unnamed protein product, partial [Rangifer tarandus platyrhynchus]
ADSLPAEPLGKHNKQERNTNLVIRRQAALRQPKTHLLKQPCWSERERKNSLPPTRIQSKVSLNMKPTQPL